MRCTLQSLIFLLAILLALTIVPTASAQALGAGRNDDPKVDVFGGFSYMRADTVVTGAPINLYGGSGSVAYNFNRWLGVVGDVGYYHANDAAANRLSLDIWSYQAGPRVSLRKHDRLVPFGQVLFGAGHAGGSLYTRSLGGGLAPIGANNGFILTAGGGLDWKLTSVIGIRLFQAEYLYSQFQNGGTYGNHQDNVRISAGIVLSFHKR